MESKTFKLFISSTFLDFKKEREILNTTIYEEISSFCKKYGYSFEIIDLHWGISLNAGYQQLTVPICLEEISKCKNGLKPNFLMMVAERRGWVPLPETIYEEDWKLISSVISNTEQKSLCKWYNLDHNAIPAVYHLKVRSGEMLKQENWEKEEKYILQILQSAAIKVFSKEKAQDFCFKSVTEKEIEHGFFMEDNKERNTLVVLRTSKNNITNSDLVSKIREKLVYNHQQAIEFENYEDDYVQYLIDFEQRVTEALKEKIFEDIERNRYIDFDTLLRNYSKEYNTVFGLREKETEFLKEYINSEKQHTMFVMGSSGSGKTALLLSMYENTSNCLGYFNGAPNALSSLKEICEDILLQVTGKKHSLQYYNFSEKFWAIIDSISFESTITVIIDALDTYYDYGYIKEEIFMHTLPINLKIIVSAIDGFMKGINEEWILHIGAFDKADSLKIFHAYMNNKSRTLTEKQYEKISELITEKTLPVNLRILSSLCAKYRSDEKIMLDDLDPIHLIESIVEQMANRYGHSKKLVKYILCLLAIAPDGMTLQELREMCFANEIIRNTCLELEEQKNIEKYLPTIYITRLLYHLGDNIRYSVSHGHEIITIAHNIYKDAVIDYEKNEKDAVFHELISYFYSMDSYVDIQKVNYRKVYSILPLVQDNYKIIEKLLTDVVFISAMVESGQMQYILMLWNLYNNIKDRRVFSTLLVHYQALQLFPKNFMFFYCNDHKELIIKESFLDEMPPITEENYIPYPFDKDSKCVFSADGHYYIVLQERTLYLWDIKMLKEIHRIVLIETLNENIQCKWIRKKEFLIYDNFQLFHYKIIEDCIICKKHYIYPKFAGQRQFRLVSLIYNEKHRKAYIIMHRRYKMVIDFDVLYRIDFKDESIKLDNIISTQNSGKFWDEKDDCLKILYKKKIRSNDIKTIDVNSCLKTSVCYSKDLTNGRYIAIFDDFIWKEEAALTIGAYIENQKIQYICPPNINYLKEVIIGDLTLTLIYNEKLLIFNMITSEFEYSYTYLSGEILNVKNDQTLAHIQGHQMRLVNISDFDMINMSCYITENTKGLFKSNFESDRNSQQINRTEFSFLSSESYLAPTMMAMVSKKIYAVAYETFDVIKVFYNGQEFIIKGCHFSQKQYLVNMFFDQNGEYLIICTNKKIEIFDLIERCKIMSPKAKQIFLQQTGYVENKKYQTLVDEISVKINNEGVLEITTPNGKCLIDDIHIEAMELIMKAQENALETFFRNKNFQCQGVYQYNNRLIISVCCMNAILLVNLDSGILEQVYYNEKGIIGCRVVNEKLIYIGTSEGEIITVSLNGQKEKDFTVKTKRIPLGFVQRNKKRILYSSSIALSVLFMIIGLYAFINKSEYYDYEKKKDLTDSFQYISGYTIQEESKGSFYDRLKLQFEKNNSGVLYQKKDDYDNNGIKETLLVEENNDKEYMYINAYMLDENHKILDQVKLAEIQANTSGISDLIEYDMDSQWTFGMDINGRSLYGDDGCEEFKLYTYRNNRFIEVVNEVEYYGGDRDPGLRLALEDIGLKLEDTFDHNISDYNDTIQILKSIYFQSIADENTLSALQSTEQKYNVSQVIYMDGNRQRFTTDGDENSSQEYVYTDLNSNIMFNVAGLPIDRTQFDNVVGGTILSSNNEDYCVSLKYEYTEDIKEKYMEYLYNDVYLYSKNVQPLSYQLNKNSFLLEYTDEIKNKRVRGWFDKNQRLLYILELEYTVDYTSRALVFEDTLVSTITNISLSSLHDMKIPVKIEKKNNFKNYYETFLTKDLSSYLPVSDEDLLYTYERVNGKEELWITTQTDYNYTIWMLYYDESENCLRYDNVVSFRNKNNLSYSSKTGMLVNQYEGDSIMEYEYKDIADYNNESALMIAKRLNKEKSRDYYLAIDDNEKVTMIDNTKFDKIYNSFGTLHNVKFYRVDDIEIPKDTYTYVFNNYLNSGLTLTVEDMLACNFSYTTYNNIEFDYGMNDYNIAIINNTFDIDVWKKFIEVQKQDYEDNNGKNIQCIIDTADDEFQSILITDIGYKIMKVEKIKSYYVIYSYEYYFADGEGENIKEENIIKQFKKMTDKISIK